MLSLFSFTPRDALTFPEPVPDLSGSWRDDSTYPGRDLNSGILRERVLRPAAPN